MAFALHETDPARYFGFYDLHGFKVFVVYVFMAAPELFPKDDWRAADEQMDLERAFLGLRYGLTLAVTEKGDSELLSRCRLLVDKAYADYHAGRDYPGQLKLEEVSALLEQLPTR